MRRSPAAAALLIAALCASSCGNKLPEVAAVEWRIESRPSAHGAAYESLSVFGSIKDEDGLDNVLELWIVNDASALAWKLTNEDWTKASEGGDTWMGGSSLATPELGPLPRGAYRLVAFDAAGQRAELAFGVSGAFPSRAAPSLSYSSREGRLAIRSGWPETLALAFDATGALLASSPAPAQAAALSEVFGQDIALRAASLGAYGYEPSARMGSFSPRVKTR
jgi:hypothetical protein